jgi:hypothetical protein
LSFEDKSLTYCASLCLRPLTGTCISNDATSTANVSKISSQHEALLLG